MTAVTANSWFSFYFSPQTSQTGTPTARGHCHRTPLRSSWLAPGRGCIPPRRCAGGKVRFSRPAACPWRWTAPSCPRPRLWPARPSTSCSARDRRGRVRWPSVSLSSWNEPLNSPETFSCSIFYCFWLTNPHWDCCQFPCSEQSAAVRADESLTSPRWGKCDITAAEREQQLGYNK